MKCSEHLILYVYILDVRRLKLLGKPIWRQLGYRR